MKKPYVKPSLSPTALLRRYQDRGLIVPDRSVALTYLSHVGPYRLKGLWFHLCDPVTKALQYASPAAKLGDG